MSTLGTRRLAPRRFPDSVVVRSVTTTVNPFLLIHEAQHGCRDATYEPSRFPVAVPYPSPHRATPAYVVVTSSDLDTSRNKASVSGLSWISRNPFGESEETTTDTDTAASVQPLDATDVETVGGQIEGDRRKVYLPGGVQVAATDSIVIDGTVYEVTDIREWPGFSRVMVLFED